MRAPGAQRNRLAPGANSECARLPAIPYKERSGGLNKSPRSAFRSEWTRTLGFLRVEVGSGRVRSSMALTPFQITTREHLPQILP